MKEGINMNKGFTLIELIGTIVILAVISLIAFPSIFKGEHIKHKKMIEIMEGHEVTVEFDKPQALQIDGETVRNVTKYSVVYK